MIQIEMPIEMIWIETEKDKRGEKKRMENPRVVGQFEIINGNIIRVPEEDRTEKKFEVII